MSKFNFIKLNKKFFSNSNTNNNLKSVLSTFINSKSNNNKIYTSFKDVYKIIYNESYYKNSINNENNSNPNLSLIYCLSKYERNIVPKLNIQNSSTLNIEDISHIDNNKNKNNSINTLYSFDKPFSLINTKYNTKLKKDDIIFLYDYNQNKYSSYAYVYFKYFLNYNNVFIINKGLSDAIDNRNTYKLIEEYINNEKNKINISYDDNNNNTLDYNNNKLFNLIEQDQFIKIARKIKDKNKQYKNTVIIDVSCVSYKYNININQLTKNTYKQIPLIYDYLNINTMINNKKEADDVFKFDKNLLWMDYIKLPYYNFQEHLNDQDINKLINNSKQNTNNDNIIDFFNTKSSISNPKPKIILLSNNNISSCYIYLYLINKGISKENLYLLNGGKYSLMKNLDLVIDKYLIKEERKETSVHDSHVDVDANGSIYDFFVNLGKNNNNSSIDNDYESD